MFEQASRQKIRFASTVGSVTVEDLWDMSLSKLNAIAKGLNKQLKESEEEDFLKVSTKKDEILQLKFDIVLHILRTKQEEQKAKRNEKKIAEVRQTLLRIKEEKMNENLRNLSIEEIEAKLSEL